MRRDEILKSGKVVAVASSSIERTVHRRSLNRHARSTRHPGGEPTSWCSHAPTQPDALRATLLTTRRNELLAVKPP